MSVYKNKQTGSWCYKFVKNGIQYHKCFKGLSKETELVIRTTTECPYIYISKMSISGK